jgi:hypothetical protein
VATPPTDLLCNLSVPGSPPSNLLYNKSVGDVVQLVRVVEFGSKPVRPRRVPGTVAVGRR